MLRQNALAILAALGWLASPSAPADPTPLQQQLDRRAQERALDRKIERHTEPPGGLSLEQIRRLEQREFRRDLSREQLRHRQRREADQPVLPQDRKASDPQLQRFEREQEVQELDFEIQDRSLR